jgi:orotidine-5'-phosphate decarboxylase
MDSRIIIPLDGKTEEEALELVEKLKGRVWAFKVNDLLADCGVEIIVELKHQGCNVMADPKLYDIPNTVKNTARKIAAAGANLCTVHASGGLAMMKAAQDSVMMGILGVTILTSFDEENAHLIYGAPIKAKVLQMARMAQMAGCIGIVCSPKELAFLKGQPGTEELVKVVPGIRPAWHQKEDDQKRKATPGDAIRDGAKYLVIGRPITGHDNPVEAAEMTNEEVEAALKELDE